ncbi:hypothetical protein APY04_2350 [Hyphomicrobium sulfonivorans]|uniref:Uncharacterized protein n=1 Tax=Hyphomicrobium sulfonivorans TaxID=121290 RepID=A0A120CUS7_HYPSL|nr:hypothetical protein APY04_2350 [Hyphomicrobium sulfonivorans]
MSGDHLRCNGCGCDAFSAEKASYRASNSKLHGADGWMQIKRPLHSAVDRFRLKGAFAGLLQAAGA